MDETLTDLSGFPVFCKSPEAVQLYNEVIESFCKQISGFLRELKKALKLDPEFVLARCLMTCFRVESFNVLNPEVTADLEFYKSVYNLVSDRERRHIDAVVAFSQRNSPKALELWDQITVYYPLDLHAVRWAFGICLEVGQFERMRDVMSRTIHHFQKDLPLYPYILSMYAFSLEETDQRDQAERICRESIAIQPKNPWGIHTMSHVIEEERSTEKGVEFLTSSRSDWDSTLLNHHIAWHLMLYYLDLNQVDNLFKEYDKMLVPNLSPDNSFALLDASSLLWRLNVMGIDVGGRWEEVTKCFQPRHDNFQLTWLESHVMMSLCYGKINESTARLALAQKMIKSMEEYALRADASDCHVASILGVPLCNALLAYGEERYEDAFRLIVPLRYDLIQIGGSWAQRQVYYITVIQAAIRSQNYNQAVALILELKARKPHSKLLERLFEEVRELMESPSSKRKRLE